MEDRLLRDLDDPVRCPDALRRLKNDIIGHEQQKNKWIARGIVAHLARILRAHRAHASSRTSNGHRAGPSRRRTGSTAIDQEACLQAITVVGSLAYGGPGYLYPLRDGQVLDSLFAMLSPIDYSPAVVLAALKALNTIADFAALEDSESGDANQGVFDPLYTDAHLNNLALTLDQSPSSAIVERQVPAAATLIWKTCHQEGRREKIARTGVLGALATQLATLVIPYTRDLGDCHGADGTWPLSGYLLTPVLQATATIITNSKDRTNQFVCSSALTAVFPWCNVDPYAWRAPPARATKRPLGTLRPSDLNSTCPPDSLHDACTTLPPLNLLATSGKQPKSGTQSSRTLPRMERLRTNEEDETPLFAWLLEVVRSEAGVTRLMAAWMLSLLFRAGLASPRRDRILCMLVVPVVVRMLGNEPFVPGMNASYDPCGGSQNLTRLVKELAPRILALLVAESPDLQKAAADALAIQRLSQMLKQTYDPIPAAQSTALWSPLADEPNPKSQDQDGKSRIETATLTPAVYHSLQVRESVLVALAAMATSKDEYRKIIIDNGVVPFVIESLKPRAAPEDATTKGERAGGIPTKSGNPTYVLLAACAAAQALSRSVSTLRTSLMDAGLATPLHTLLKSPVVEVQTAATAVIANIVLEFSPMRDAVISAGVLKVLCEHAHSDNAKLQLQSMWSLKHLVHSASNPLKIACLHELGSEWLMQVLRNDAARRVPPSQPQSREDAIAPIAMGTPNAAGEQVDLLNAIDTESQGSIPAGSDGGDDAIDDVDDEDDEVNMIDSIGALSRPLYPARSNQSHSTPQLGSSSGERLPTDGSLETDVDVHRAGRDALAIQEQGLDFIRNLICGPDSAEMIDYVLQELGQQRLFETFATLLRSRPVEIPTRDRKFPGLNVKYVSPATEIVVAVCFILIHFAAGLPRHRQLLLSQTSLLKLLVPLFTYQASEVRVCCAWIVINFTWVEDQADKAQSRSRALELSKLGVLDQLRRLEGDPDLDVRERAKQALQQMKELGCQ